MDDPQSQVAIVTGASSGIGAAVARFAPGTVAWVLARVGKR